MLTFSAGIAAIFVVLSVRPVSAWPATLFAAKPAVFEVAGLPVVALADMAGDAVAMRAEALAWPSGLLAGFMGWSVSGVREILEIRETAIDVGLSWFVASWLPSLLQVRKPRPTAQSR